MEWTEAFTYYDVGGGGILRARFTAFASGKRHVDSSPSSGAERALVVALRGAQGVATTDRWSRSGVRRTTSARGRFTTGAAPSNTKRCVAFAGVTDSCDAMRREPRGVEGR
jgi:hypothetical protein